MLSKNDIKKIRSLGHKKFRVKHRKFIAEGDKIVKEVIKSDFQVTDIYATSSWIEKNEIPTSCNAIEVSNNDLKKISQLTTPNQVIALIDIPSTQEVPSPGDEFIIAIDNIQDPGNLGTIIRTSDWFGIKHIICSDETVDLYNPKVIQATMGSFCRINICYIDLAGYLSNHYKNNPVYGSFLNGESAFDITYREKGILVIGNESRGISPETGKYITQKLTIPPFNRKNVEMQADSLNVSVAAGILMAIMRKQF